MNTADGQKIIRNLDLLWGQAGGSHRWLHFIGCREPLAPLKRLKGATIFLPLVAPVDQLQGATNKLSGVAPLY